MPPTALDPGMLGRRTDCDGAIDSGVMLRSVRTGTASLFLDAGEAGNGPHPQRMQEKQSRACVGVHTSKL